MQYNLWTEQRKASQFKTTGGKGCCPLSEDIYSLEMNKGHCGSMIATRLLRHYTGSLKFLSLTRMCNINTRLIQFKVCVSKRSWSASSKVSQCPPALEPLSSPVSLSCWEGSQVKSLSNCSWIWIPGSCQPKCR